MALKLGAKGLGDARVGAVDAVEDERLRLRDLALLLEPLEELLLALAEDDVHGAQRPAGGGGLFEGASELLGGARDVGPHHLRDVEGGLERVLEPLAAQVLELLEDDLAALDRLVVDAREAGHRGGHLVELGDRVAGRAAGRPVHGFELGVDGLGLAELGDRLLHEIGGEANGGVQATEHGGHGHGLERHALELHAKVRGQAAVLGRLRAEGAHEGVVALERRLRGGRGDAVLVVGAGEQLLLALELLGGDARRLKAVDELGQVPVEALRLTRGGGVGGADRGQPFLELSHPDDRLVCVKNRFEQDARHRPLPRPRWPASDA